MIGPLQHKDPHTDPAGAPDSHEKVPAPASLNGDAKGKLNLAISARMWTSSERQGFRATDATWARLELIMGFRLYIPEKAGLVHPFLGFLGDIELNQIKRHRRGGPERRPEGSLTHGKKTPAMGVNEHEPRAEREDVAAVKVAALHFPL